jgi:hypothetical protein
MMEILCKAIAEQTKIGWVNLFWGFFSAKWRDLASRNMSNSDVPPINQDGNRPIEDHRHKESGATFNSCGKDGIKPLHKCNKDDENKFLILGIR